MSVGTGGRRRRVTEVGFNCIFKTNAYTAYNNVIIYLRRATEVIILSGVIIKMVPRDSAVPIYLKINFPTGWKN